MLDLTHLRFMHQVSLYLNLTSFMKIKFSARFNHIGLFGKNHVVLDNGTLLSTQIPDDEADGMLGYWDITSDFQSFQGIKLLYCCEPSWYFKDFRQRKVCKIINSLCVDEFAFFNHSNPNFRVPHLTHTHLFHVDSYNPDRRLRCATVASNFRHPLLRHKDMQFRVAFITHPLVDLYGRKENWSNFKKNLFSPKTFPFNYIGEVEGYHGGHEKLDLLAKYKVAVCLENVCEERYFTEKFVDAVRSGCIPIYKAHPSIKKTVLEGAYWVDPTDFNHSIDETIQYALSLNGEAVFKQNIEWFMTGRVKETYILNIYNRLGEILLGKIEGRLTDQSKFKRI